MKSILILLALIIVGGCASNKRSGTRYIFYADGISVSKEEARNAWFIHLAENNMNLYDAVVRAVIISQRSNKDVYISRDRTNKVTHYTLSEKNMGGANVLSVNYPNREIVFDHYNDSDGRPMSIFVEKIYVDKKTDMLHSQLKLGEFN